MHLEHRQIVRRCLDHDSPPGRVLLALVIVRAMLIAEDGLDTVQIQGRPRPIDQRLENLIHLAAGAEPQIPAVFHLKHRILILKGALLLFFQVQGKTQAGVVDPALPELTQSPCSLFFRQGICDLRQVRGVARSSEAVLLFGKFHSGFLCLRCYKFVPIEDHLRAEGWMAAHFDSDVPPVWVPNMKGIMIHVRPRIFRRQLAEFSAGRRSCFPHQRRRLGNLVSVPRRLAGSARESTAPGPAATPGKIAPPAEEVVRLGGGAFGRCGLRRA